MNETKGKEGVRRPLSSAQGWVLAGVAGVLVAAGSTRAIVPTIDVAAIGQLVDGITTMSRQTEQLAGIGNQLGKVTEIMGALEEVQSFKSDMLGKLEGMVPDTDAFQVLDEFNPVGGGGGDGAGDGGDGTDHGAGGQAPDPKEDTHIGATPRFDTEEESREWLMERYFVSDEVGAGPTGAGAAGTGVLPVELAREARQADLRAQAARSYVVAAATEKAWESDHEQLKAMRDELGNADSLREEVALLVQATLKQARTAAYGNRIEAERLRLEAMGTLAQGDVLVDEKSFRALKGEEAPEE